MVIWRLSKCPALKGGFLFLMKNRGTLKNTIARIAFPAKCAVTPDALPAAKDAKEAVKRMRRANRETFRSEENFMLVSGQGEVETVCSFRHLTFMKNRSAPFVTVVKFFRLPAVEKKPPGDFFVPPAGA
jgi:hypothetical protein